MFTGSTDVARLIAASLAQRVSAQGHVIPLIAETGGQNALVADSSALAEQVVADVLASAFDSAGQRCSALRLLCLQDDVVDRVLDMLRGALREWVVGNPDRMHTDVGPVIDEDARTQIEQHIAHMSAQGLIVTRPAREVDTERGHFVSPAIIEIDSISRLQREVFGPVLHVLRYRRDELPQVLDAINATGYGLTFGVHSRIDETIAKVTQRVHAGNVYVNRNIIGAVVGVQPFGGMGLSGTGPKAGGPLYLYRLLQAHESANNPALHALNASDASQPRVDATTKIAQEKALKPLLDMGKALQTSELLELQVWPDASTASAAAQACQRYLACSVLGQTFTLPGPTGEINHYQLLPRGTVWAAPKTVLGLLHQISAVLASGNSCRVTLPALLDGVATRLLQALPALVQERVALASTDALLADAQWSALLFEGDADDLQALALQVAQRTGPLVRIESLTSAQLASGTCYDISALMHEQSISTNTAAAGGNAQLMTMG